MQRTDLRPAADRHRTERLEVVLERLSHHELEPPLRLLYPRRPPATAAQLKTAASQLPRSLAAARANTRTRKGEVVEDRADGTSDEATDTSGYSPSQPKADPLRQVLSPPDFGELTYKIAWEDHNQERHKHCHTPARTYVNACPDTRLREALPDSPDHAGKGESEEQARQLSKEEGPRLKCSRHAFQEDDDAKG